MNSEEWESRCMFEVGFHAWDQNPWADYNIERDDETSAWWHSRTCICQVETQNKTTIDCIKWQNHSCSTTSIFVYNAVHVWNKSKNKKMIFIFKLSITFSVVSYKHYIHWIEINDIIIIVLFIMMGKNPILNGVFNSHQLFICLNLSKAN